MGLKAALVFIASLALSPALLSGEEAAGERKLFNFDSDRSGEPPRGFTVEAGEWRVEADPGAPSPPNVLQQLAKSQGSVFNLILAGGASFKDLDLSVKMEAVAGDEDRGGGLVWRARDSRNYYIARQNPLEDNFRVYKVVDGKRIQLQSAELKAGPGWHTFRVVMAGDHIECFHDGKKHLDARDSTFAGAGRVGLWTKSDARSRFDDLTAGPPSKEAEAAPGGGAALDPARIGEAAGAQAALQPDGVVRIAWSRSEVPVRVNGMSLKPFAGLGSWAAFMSSGKSAMVMGDTVVFQDEVTPAMDAAFARGLEVTGLHNHFFYDEPKVYFMHLGGAGEPEELARAVKSVWDAIKKVRSERPEPAERWPGPVPAAGGVDPGPLERILGQKSQLQDGVVKVTVARKGVMHGVEVGGSMGLTTWAAFSGSDELAAVDGDFIMTGPEVQPVLKALRKGNLQVVALHNHMIGESPPFYFTHFWGQGPSQELARGIAGALKAQADAGRARGEH
jgi:hypothetical protein